MKECFVITTYCDTQKKIDVLNSTIDNIKKFGKDILIHAHFPLSEDIQNKVNHYISSENFIIDNESKVSFFWTFKYNYKMYNYKTNYNYTVLKQYNEIASYLFSIGYDVLHILNYDSNITSELYEISKKYCQDKSVFYQNFLIKEKYVTATWFSLNKKDRDFFINMTSMEQYVKSSDYTIEHYLGNSISKIDAEFVELENYNYKLLYKNEISFDGVHYRDIYEGVSMASRDFEFFFKKDGYSIFGGYFNKTLSFLFHTITKRLYVEIQVRDNIFNIIIDNEMFFMDTGIKIEGIKNEEVNIKINDVVLDDVLVDRMLKNKIELINNDKW